jgi:hypothetical protein
MCSVPHGRSLEELMGERLSLPAPGGDRQLAVDRAIGRVASWRGGRSTGHRVTPEV